MKNIAKIDRNSMTIIIAMKTDRAMPARTPNRSKNPRDSQYFAFVISIVRLIESTAPSYEKIAVGTIKVRKGERKKRTSNSTRKSTAASRKKPMNASIAELAVPGLPDAIESKGICCIKAGIEASSGEKITSDKIETKIPTRTLTLNKTRNFSFALENALPRSSFAPCRESLARKKSAASKKEPIKRSTIIQAMKKTTNTTARFAMTAGIVRAAERPKRAE